LALRAIYSRSENTATATATVAAAAAAALAISSQSRIKPDVYFDSPGADGKSIDNLLARDDISAVIICLPIPVQAGIIQKAIAAGKHVLSEKPIARDIASARDLIAWVHRQPITPVWAVAENFRFNESVQYAAEQLRCIGGQLVTFRLSFSNFISKENKYFQTECERTSLAR
jgi:predicted dehydrogenase